MGVLDLMRPIARFAALALTAMLAFGASGSIGAATSRHSYTIPHVLRLATS